MWQSGQGAALKLRDIEAGYRTLETEQLWAVLFDQATVFGAAGHSSLHQSWPAVKARATVDRNRKILSTVAADDSGGDL